MDHKLSQITSKADFLRFAHHALNASDSDDSDIIPLDPPKGSNAKKIDNDGPSLATKTKVVEKRPVPVDIDSVREGQDLAPGKKKRRDKADIEHERNQKKLARIQREAQTAKNSKCEQYLFCHCSRLVEALDSSVSYALHNLFEERKIREQLVWTEKNDATVVWKRKKVSGQIENNEVKRVEEWTTEHAFLLVVDGSTFGVIVETGLEEFVQRICSSHKPTNELRPQLTLAVLGSHSVNATKMGSLTLSLFESTRAQVRFVKNPGDLCLMIAQFHRALAKFERKLDEPTTGIHVDEEKGVELGPDLVTNWWGLMLSHVHRITEDSRRAILRTHPNPFQLMDRLATLPSGQAMQMLADIRTETGRFVGPVMAQKLFVMLTSMDGRQILENKSI